jgi:hypothetical protein
MESDDGGRFGCFCFLFFFLDACFLAFLPISEVGETLASHRDGNVILTSGSMNELLPILLILARLLLGALHVTRDKKITKFHNF